MGKIKLKLQGQTTATSEWPFAEKGTARSYYLEHFGDT